MATVPYEQVTQRNKTADVSITDGSEDTLIGEKYWLSTTSLPDAVVNTKSVHGNQANRDTVEDRVMAGHNAATNLHDLGIGEAYVSYPVTIVGTGVVTASMANSATASTNIAQYVFGTQKPFTYEIDESSEDDFVTSTMIGSVLQYVSGTSDGTDTILVNVTDQGGSSVQVTVNVTVA